MAFKYVLLSALMAVASAGYISPSSYTTYAAAPAIVTKVVNPAHDAVASTHQNVVRSFAGTVSQYSKSVDTPYSSVRKQDTRVSNNVYTPAIAKTITYATAPAPTATVYTHAVPVTQTVYTQHQHQHQHQQQEQEQRQARQQEQQQHYQQQQQHHHDSGLYTHAVPTKTITYTAPAAQVYHHSAPAPQVYHQAEPAQQIYHHEPAQQVYHRSAPATVTTTYNHGPDASTYSHSAPGVAAYGSSQTVRYSPAEMVSHMSFDGFGTHWGF